MDLAETLPSPACCGAAGKESRRPMLRAGAIVAALCLGVALPAVARDYEAGRLRIVHPYARAMPPGARTGGAYFTIINRGHEADRLVGASSPRAAAVELHSMNEAGGVMRMRPVESIPVQPGETVKLVPNGLHLMIIDPKPALRAGERFPVQLSFAHAGKVDVELEVESAGAGTPSGGMRMH